MSICFTSIYVHIQEAALYRHVICPMWAAATHSRLYARTQMLRACDLPSQQVYEVGAVILIPILQIRKPGLREYAALTNVWHCLPHLEADGHDKQALEKHGPRVLTGRTMVTGGDNGECFPSAGSKLSTCRALITGTSDEDTVCVSYN